MDEPTVLVGQVAKQTLLSDACERAASTRVCNNKNKKNDSLNDHTSMASWP